MTSVISGPTVAIYRQNLEFFQVFAPSIYQRILESDNKHPTFLEISGGDFDVEITNKQFYGGGAFKFTQSQVEVFWKNQPNRIHLMPQKDTNDRGVVNQFYSAMMKRADEYKVTFAENRCDLRSYHLVVFGVGLGIHLPMLIERLKCRTLTILEPSLDMLHASLYTLNWRALNNNFPEEKGCRLNLLITDEPGAGYDYIRNIIKYQQTPAFLDGFCLFQHYETDLFKAVGSRIFGTPKDLFSNFGFLYDDMNMVQNTYFNLRDNNPRIYQRPGAQKKFPAFVVGAGPSLDTSVETIRHYQNDAIIISCGTALSALLSDDIKPDFHVELENVPNIYEETLDLKKMYGLSDITLVGSTSIFPTIASLYDSVVLFFRAGVASDPMFRINEGSEIPYCFPQVANLGLSLAGELGCETVYLFGVDLGAVNPSQHYAKKTSKAHGRVAYGWQDEGLELVRPANYGGTAYSHPDFIECLTFLEEYIRDNKNIKNYFNCSNGIAIEGTQPLPLDQINIAKTRPAKAEVIAEQINGCNKYTREMFEDFWDGDARLEANTRLCKKLTSIMNEAEPGYEGTIDALAELAHAMPLNTKSPEVLLYRGSMICALAAAYYFLCRTGEDHSRSAFTVIVREEMIRLLGSIAERVEIFYHQLRDPKQAKLQNYIEIH